MTFKEYYEYYLTLHQDSTNRYLHVLGQMVTISYIVSVIVIGWWWALLATPFVVYPFAWSGHFFFENNQPAAWTRPLWAKLADWVMMKDIFLEKIPW